MNPMTTPPFRFRPGADPVWDPTHPATAPAGLAADRTERQILFVDDDESVREISVLILRRAGFDVETADDGESAWSALQGQPFRLLVTDNRMPRLTGVDLVRRLRATGSALPVIIASGMLNWEEADIPDELQPLALLPKPFNGPDLLTKVRAALASPLLRLHANAVLSAT